MANSLSPNFSQSFASLAKRSICLFLLTLSIGKFLAQARPVFTAAPTKTCKDHRAKRILVDGEKKRLCRYCRNKDTEERCNNTYVKKKTKTKKNGEVKEVEKIYDPKELCTCTCADYLDIPETEDSLDIPERDSASSDDILCPVEPPQIDDGAVKSPDRDTCSGDGGDEYEKDQECNYNWHWQGCNYDDIKCITLFECTCDPEYANTSTGWKCTPHDSLYCPNTDPRDGPVHPPYHGQTCQEDEPRPRPQDGPVIDPGIGDDKLCPDENPLDSINTSGNTIRSSVKTLGDRDTCTGDGGDVYEKGQECNYNWVWKGCTYDTLTCAPVVECTCRDDNIPSNTQTGWSCHSAQIEICDEPGRGEEDPRPPERGQPCRDPSNDMLIIRR